MDNTINAVAAKPAQLFDAGPNQSTTEQQLAFYLKQEMEFLGAYIGSILHSPIVTENLKNHSEINASEINAAAKPSSLFDAGPLFDAGAKGTEIEASEINAGSLFDASDIDAVAMPSSLIDV